MMYNKQLGLENKHQINLLLAIKMIDIYLKYQIWFIKKLVMCIFYQEHKRINYMELSEEKIKQIGLKMRV